MPRSPAASTSPDPRRSGHRIGIDVGGTFTDFSVLRLANGEVFNFKEPSTPADPSIAVADGLAALMARHGLSPPDIGLIVHGTTIGLNAILQRKGAALALVVSDGNRDILEIGRGRMAQPYAMFGDKEPALVPREDVHTCSARIGADGTVIAFPAGAELDALAGRLRERGAHAVAITLLNAYANPALEQRLKAELSARLPLVMLTTSSEIWPEMREYERCMIAALNASIQPLMTQYYTRLQARLEALGVTCPLFVTASNGGTLSLHSAVRRPIDTVLSGPASGVVAAANLAAELDIERVVTVDMGGTSSDMAVCSATRPELTTHTQLGDFPLTMPTVNVTAIGAGGGSIVRVDDHGLLKVGPESAGADPGPVCYARGGTQPTLTDCYLAIGLLRPDGFADGRLTLDRDAALQSLDAIGAALKLPAPHRALRAATAALSVATAKMATEMLKELARRGVDPNEVVLLPFGGAGPTHAAMLAEEVRVHRIAVPLAPGLFCARGALAADARRDFIRTVKRELDDGTAALAAQHIDTMRDEAARWLDAEGELIATRTFVRSLDMRYVGQAYEINVEIGDETFSRASLAARFHEAHRRRHGFADASAPVEVHSVRVQAVGGMQRPPAARWRRTAAAAAAVRRPIWQGDDWIDFAVVQRHGLAAGNVLRGPTVVEQADTTLAVPFGWIATVRPDGSLWMEKTA